MNYIQNLLKTPFSSLSLEEKVQIKTLEVSDPIETGVEEEELVLEYFRNLKTGCAPKKKYLIELFNETHPDQHPISQSMVSIIEFKYRNFGHVRDLPKSGRPSKSEEDQLHVLLAIEENHHSTLNQLASDFNMVVCTVHKIMKKAKYDPYKVCLVHELSEDDFDRRNQFCEQMQELCTNDNNFAKLPLLSYRESPMDDGVLHSTVIENQIGDLVLTKVVSVPANNKSKKLLPKFRGPLKSGRSSVLGQRIVYLPWLPKEIGSRTTESQNPADGHHHPVI
ncbi:hypothetical protein NQ318_020750 [Aromia moschata]|uniref:Uncharacterized protein n=1 Tax=Aromia moschata TaxID=1265417 RepID=A0AAV8YYA5_9CUCU|nr:hypothetical protein NQ318_020750 [Aromia moschata]